MKFETVKSFILFILVVISILLTFGLWYYQPTYDALYDEEEVSELDTDIGGSENDLIDVIKPDAMILHNNAADTHFTFEDPGEYFDLYDNMQTWSLSDFEDKQMGELEEPEDNLQFEVEFPTELPMKLLGDIFSIDDDAILPSWSFEKFFISLDDEASTLDLTFVSTEDEVTETAIVHDEKVYDLLADYMSSEEDMLQLTSFDIPESDGGPIYIPADSVSMKKYALTVEDSDPNKLVNALFDKPSLVNNTTEELFTDGQRRMELRHEERLAEFVAPYPDSSYPRMETMDLIDRSLQNINDHRGWTNDYYLSDLKSSTNQITYRMHYKGYPVFNDSKLSVIEQKWKDQEIHEYDRPLFQLKNVLPQDDKKELASGEEVKETLSDNPNYDMSNIRDLKIGYTLSYEERAAQSVTLKPDWYVNYDGNWRRVKFDEADKERD